MGESQFDKPRTHMAAKTWRYWRNLASFALVAMSVAVFASTALFMRAQALRYLHPPRTVSGGTPLSYGIAYEDVELVTSDGLLLAAWYTPSENGALILVSHGYAAHRPPDVHALFAQNGYGVLSWDSRAHGLSQGELCTFGVHEQLDVEAALTFAAEQPSVDHIGAWGGSMGGATLILSAAKHEAIEAIAVDGSFAAIEDELDVVVRFAWLRPLMRFFAELESGVGMDAIRPVDVIGRISPRPVYIIQGLSDEAIQIDSGSQLFSAAGEPRQLWSVPGVGHMGVMHAYPQRYERDLITFFESALLQPEDS